MTLSEVFECPLCDRQTVTTKAEGPLGFVPICEVGHRRVEMEQRLPEAFEAAKQTVWWERSDWDG